MHSRHWSVWFALLDVNAERLTVYNDGRDAAPVLGLLSISCANEIDFVVAVEPGWILFNFEDVIVYDTMAFNDPDFLQVCTPRFLCSIETSRAKIK